MVGPSLEAIRKFKEQQERKKREELERKVQDKLSTLEHRASKGDRKAKQELKRIEKIKEERPKLPPPKPVPPRVEPKQPPKTRKPAETDFDELIRIAKQNTNEIRKHEKAQTESKLKPKPKPDPIVKLRSDAVVEPRLEQKLKSKPKPSQVHRPRPISGAYEQHRHSKLIHAPMRMTVADNYDDEYEDEDDYESDGFVVDDEYDDAREELSKTIKSVFRYDKRRCDLREEEIDRQYRAIGRVSTFEDLEREERRASRLGAVEDARALRDEEERKKMKRLRLNGRS